jgi:tetratricopeptide (TPR) repeat protein
LLRARVALEAGQLAQAVDIARGLLTLTPDAAESAAAGRTDTPDHRAEASYLLGLALARDGRSDDARAALEAALRGDPEHRGARQALRALSPAQP